MHSYASHNLKAATERAIEKLESGVSVGFLSDRGTPGISDPGYRVIRSCHERGIPIISIPGANAAISALAASGLPTDEFLFVGFLPAKQGARREKLAAIRNVTSTIVFYEAPHRIDAALQDIQEVLGDREVCVAREITKIHEQYLFGRLATVRETVKPIGEFVVVIEGAREAAPDLPPSTRDEVLKRLGMSRNELYDLFFKK
jgi:16S rRNA (cytidine1402-2'-O)-methyltransferase